MRATNMIGSLLAISLLAMGAALFTVPAHGADEGQAEGWVKLTEGDDLSKHWQTTGNWSMEDGVVHLDPRPGERGWQRYDAYLWLKDKQYDDFQIAFDYKVAKSGNSGFYFNVGNKKQPVATGVEVQIYDSGNKPKDARLTDHDSGGVIPGIPPTKNTANPAGEWNHFLITVKGDKLTVELNGEVVNEVDLTKGALGNRPDAGYIGFQDHALPLWLKDIRIREL